MTVRVNTKIQPLVEDLIKTIPGEFLTSTVYKRWLVEHNLDGQWSNYSNQIKRSWHIAGLEDNPSIAEDTLACIVNLFYEHNHDSLPSFITKLLSLYAADEDVSDVAIDDIKKDLRAANYSEESVAMLDSVTVTVPSALKVIMTPEQKISSLEEAYLAIEEVNSDEAIRAYRKWHSETLVYFSSIYSESDPDYAKFKNLDNSGNGYTLYNNFKAIYSIYKLLMNNAANKNPGQFAKQGRKSPMVFISHSSQDTNFVEALVTLLESIGLNGQTLFCSSVREYGVRLSGDIYETLRELFTEHDLYVIFVHSPRYYESAVALNEMGAAWVLKTDFCSFLTKDMSFDQMKGVVNGAKISIKVDDKAASSLLNDLYKQLRDIFSLNGIGQNTWERKRDQFLGTVRNL